jgi:hypothetical protein
LRTAATEADTAAAESKQRSAAIGKEAAAITTEPAAVEKAPDAAFDALERQETFSNLSMTAALGDALVHEEKAEAEAKSSFNSGDSHNKDQSAGGPGEKASTATSSNKSSDTKPDDSNH